MVVMRGVYITIPNTTLYHLHFKDINVYTGLYNGYTGVRGMWENVNEFPKNKRRKYPKYTSE